MLELVDNKEIIDGSVSNESTGTCIICCVPLDSSNSTQLSCCNQNIHTPCMNRHGVYAQREYLKNHQSLDGFVLFCILCKQPCGFNVNATSSISIPSTIPSLSMSLSLSHSFSIGDITDTENGSDPSYVPEVHISADSIITIDEGTKFCFVCAEQIDSTTVTTKCCNKVMHSSCNYKVVDALKSLNMNHVYRGASCVNCTVSRFMVKSDFEISETFASLEIGNGQVGLHPLGCSPNAHYLLSSVILYIYGFKFHNTNPWCINPLVLEYPELEAVIDKIKMIVVLSPADIVHVRGLVSNIGNTRNVFISPDNLCDIVNRAGEVIVGSLMDILRRIHSDTVSMYQACAASMKEEHDKTALVVKDVLKGSIFPKHMCFSPFCKELCVGNGGSTSPAPSASLPRHDPMCSPVRAAPTVPEMSVQGSHFPLSPKSPDQQQGERSSPRKNHYEKKAVLQCVILNSSNEKFDLKLARETLNITGIITDTSEWVTVTQLINMVLYDFDKYDWDPILEILETCGANVSNAKRRRLHV